MNIKLTKTLVAVLILSTLAILANAAWIKSNNEIERLEDERTKLNDDISSLTDAMSEYEVIIDEKDTEIASLNDALTDSQEKLSELTEELNTLNEDEEVIVESINKTTIVEETATEEETYIPEEPAITETNDSETDDEILIYSITNEDGESYIPPYYEDVTDDDIYWIQRVVETETYGADMMSKSHVASVVLNRIGAGTWGNSAEEVVTSPSQFVYFRTTISQSTIDAVNYVLENGDTAQGALYFHSGGYTATFCGRSCIFGDDVGHYFY